MPRTRSSSPHRRLGRHALPPPKVVVLGETSSSDGDGDDKGSKARQQKKEGNGIAAGTTGANGLSTQHEKKTLASLANYVGLFALCLVLVPVILGTFHAWSHSFDAGVAAATKAYNRLIATSIVSADLFFWMFMPLWLTVAGAVLLDAVVLRSLEWLLAGNVAAVTLLRRIRTKVALFWSYELIAAVGGGGYVAFYIWLLSTLSP